jgi:hypothetical protein
LFPTDHHLSFLLCLSSLLLFVWGEWGGRLGELRVGVSLGIEEFEQAVPVDGLLLAFELFEKGRPDCYW